VWCLLRFHQLLADADVCFSVLVRFLFRNNERDVAEGWCWWWRYDAVMYTLTHLCRGKIEKRVRKRVGMSRNVRIQQTANKKSILCFCAVSSLKNSGIFGTHSGWKVSIGK
jgi:hypothetical protein